MENENKPIQITETSIHKEIDLLQSCIERMSKNSFSCKGWDLTLITGVFVLIQNGINYEYILITILLVNLCFWVLDSNYLLLEQKYRDKYDWVIQMRKNGNTDFQYDLNPNNQNTILYANKKRSLIKTMFSNTILPMYVGITILIIVFTIKTILGG